jgi:hypothetical protein
MLSTGLLGKVAVTFAATAVLVGGPAAAQPDPSATHRVKPPNGHARAQAKGHDQQDKQEKDAKHAEHGGRPVGPDATGPAAHGLCTAYSHRGHGRSFGHSIAMRNLARAAGGADRIQAYCSSVR